MKRKRTPLACQYLSHQRLTKERKMEEPEELKFELASQNEVNELQPQIERLLAALGHPEALVTDESTFLDFLSPFEYPSRGQAQKALREQLAKAGITTPVHVGAPLVALARLLKEQEEE
jgi:hypothetical protein